MGLILDNNSYLTGCVCMNRSNSSVKFHIYQKPMWNGKRWIGIQEWNPDITYLKFIISEFIFWENTRFLLVTLFFNSDSMLLNFLMSWASAVAYVLLNTYKHHHTKALLVFTTFVSMSKFRSINVVCMCFVFYIHLHFHYD